MAVDSEKFCLKKFTIFSTGTPNQPSSHLFHRDCCFFQSKVCCNVCWQWIIMDWIAKLRGKLNLHVRCKLNVTCNKLHVTCHMLQITSYKLYATCYMVK